MNLTRIKLPLLITRNSLLSCYFMAANDAGYLSAKLQQSSAPPTQIKSFSLMADRDLKMPLDKQSYVHTTSLRWNEYISQNNLTSYAFRVNLQITTDILFSIAAGFVNLGNRRVTFLQRLLIIKLFASFLEYRWVVVIEILSKFLAVRLFQNEVISTIFLCLPGVLQMKNSK